MSEYSPPVKDIQFVLDEVVSIGDFVQTAPFEDVDRETIDLLISEIGRFMADVVAPTNRDGDQVGAIHREDGSVELPESFHRAYQQYVDSGFGAVPFDPEFGGGGFPWTMAIAIQEMMTSANMAFALCPLLTQGAIEALTHHGTHDQQAMYLPKMLTGEWTGTMNLTEPQAGSDVGALTAKAIPVGDGSFKITGQKIFITFGEHELAENIVHLVLARTPDAGPGTRGISMFLVPKFLVNEDGSLGERNDVSCVSIEHKMGIHGSPTCVLSYGDNGGAIGWLIGDENAGMRNMFTMMNNARLSVGLQGLAVAERAYQEALAYAQERTQGTAVGAEKGTSSPIIDHADVRRLLMTQRSWIDAMRCLLYENAAAMDRSLLTSDSMSADDAESQKEWADLLIPLSKSLCTDLGNELTSMAVQVFGGMGFVEETGAAQHYRDIRIGAIYEGTNGIQAADLVGRKLPMKGGAVVMNGLDMCAKAGQELAGHSALGQFGENLEVAVAATRRASEWLLEHGAKDPNEALAGSSPYLRMLGTVVCGGLMARAAVAASQKEDDSDGFYEAKVVSAKFFGEQILPSAAALEQAVTAGSGDLFALKASQLG